MFFYPWKRELIKKSIRNMKIKIKNRKKKIKKATNIK